MDRSSIERALTGLMPTLNGPLPPELMELALSLLARSRSLVQSLKPDEEIARSYACAQLACERLKKRLNLPTITSRPPCPPRIYKKLFTYLESTLPDGARSAPNTPRKTASQAAASARTTPKTPLSTRRTPGSRARHQEQVQKPPEYVMPVIRALSKIFSHPAVVPHVYTGVESTYTLLAHADTALAPDTPSKRPKRSVVVPQPQADEVSNTRVLALVAAMLFYVLSRILDQNITPEEYTEWMKKAVSTIVKTEKKMKGHEEDLTKEIDDLIEKAQQDGWLQMEWFQNIAPQQDVDEMEGVETTNGAAKSKPGRTLKDTFSSEHIGLGTMMQEATDYLSERNRADYKRWKAGIMARIEQIEAV